jgi:hypothetical protein
MYICGRVSFMSQIMLTMFIVDLVSFRCEHNLGLNYAKRYALRASPHPWVPMDITLLSIIQPRFMLIPFTLRESPSYSPMTIWVSTRFY